MKKILTVLVLVGLVLIFATPTVKKETKPQGITKPSPTKVPTPPPTRSPENFHKSIFVPDWNLTEETILHNGYDRWIYFGSGEKVGLFKSDLPNKNLWLTVKAASLDELEKINLDNYDFKDLDGVVIDLEINVLGSDKNISSINDGVKRIYNQAKQKNLKTALAMYGDLFYRKRPYDLKTLNQYSDEIMIMAYDFSKSYGEPGRNYPYDEFKKMIGDYLKEIPPAKLTVIYGMYGYDWTMKDDKPLKPAESVTLGQIRKKYLGKICDEHNCKVTTEWTKEKSVTYSGSDGYEHIVYFEDDESADVKSEFLREQGIGSVAYWAWGYF